MTALATQREAKPYGPYPVPTMLDVPQKANTIIYNGAIVVGDAGYGAPATGAAGLIALGVADLVPCVNSSDSTGLASGAKIIRVRQGVFNFKNSGGGDAIAVGDRWKVAYIVDDQTVAKTSGGGARSVAGIIMRVDGDGIWIAVGVMFAALAAQLAAGGAGNPEDISASGVLSTTLTTRLAVSGTKAYTLADGAFAGQRKRIYCLSAASTPVGVVTPAHASGFTSLTFSTANGDVDLEWDSSLGTPAWKLTGVHGTVTVTP